MLNYLLSKVWFYNIVQLLLAKKSHEDIHKYLSSQGLLSTKKKILDIGCGPGDQSKYFINNYTGVDISSNYISRAKKKYPQHRFFRLDATIFKLNESFDNALSIGLYHHLCDSDTIKSIKNVLTHLNKNGHFYIVDAIYPEKPYKNILGFIIRKMDRGKYVRYLDNYIKLLINSDLKIISVTPMRSGLIDYVIIKIQDAKAI